MRFRLGVARWFKRFAAVRAVPLEVWFALGFVKFKFFPLHFTLLVDNVASFLGIVLIVPGRLTTHTTRASARTESSSDP